MIFSSGIINTIHFEQVLKNIPKEIHNYENIQGHNGGCFNFPDGEHLPWNYELAIHTKSTELRSLRLVHCSYNVIWNAS